MIQTLLVEDQPIYMDGLLSILSHTPGITIVGQAYNGEDALHLLSQIKVDIVLLDINMPKMDGIQVAPQILSQYPDTDIIMLTIYDDPTLILKLLDLEVSGYLLKEATGKEIRQAIQTVFHGGTYYGVEVMRKVTNYMRGKTNNPKVNTLLTPREMEVLELIIQELTAVEIGERLCISKETVDTHRKNIREKLQVRSNAGIVREALRLGIFDLAS